MKTWSLRKKIYVGSLVVSIVVVGALGFNAYKIYESVEQEIENQRQLMVAGLQGQLSQLSEAEPVYKTVVENAIAQMKSQGLKEGQIDLSKGDAIVDKIKTDYGSTATFFVKEGDDYIRRSTNVLNEQGQRAVGTVLDKGGSPYKALVEGESFFGQAIILGRPFYTGYVPVFSESGGEDRKIVGAIYVGYLLQSLVSTIEFVDNSKILQNGFFAVYRKAAAGSRLLTRDSHAALALSEYQKWILDPHRSEHLSVDKWQFTMSEKAGGYVLVAAIDTQELKSLAVSRVLVSSGSLMVIIFGTILAIFVFARRLESTLSGVVENAENVGATVASTAVQLTSTGQALSDGASQAAASIEETVASLEELVSMVTRNAEGARNAQGLTQEAQKLTEAGEQQSQALLQAMARVQESSKKVAEIVTVIDDIAFQTNLLALNASVEAARAGDHGKGFAVVADAVRSLAQKSAESAKDIGKLIGESSTEVDEGNKVAMTSAKAFEDIKGGIMKLTYLVNEIAVASAEQSEGLKNISQAMGQFDQTSQSNAASAEEAAAVSENLSANANELSGIVSDLKGLINGRAA